MSMQGISRLRGMASDVGCLEVNVVFKWEPVERRVYEVGSET